MNNFVISSSVIFEFGTITNLVLDTFGVKVFFSLIRIGAASFLTNNPLILLWILITFFKSFGSFLIFVAIINIFLSFYFTY